MKTKQTCLTARPKKRRVTFRLKGADACAVFLAGSFNDWDPAVKAMKSVDGKAEWRLQVSLEPGMHEYLFVVDGRWTPDPEAGEAVPNPYGGMNSVRRV